MAIGVGHILKGARHQAENGGDFQFDPHAMAKSKVHREVKLDVIHQKLKQNSHKKNSLKEHNDKHQHERRKRKKEREGKGQSGGRKKPNDGLVNIHNKTGATKAAAQRQPRKDTPQKKKPGASGIVQPGTIANKHSMKHSIKTGSMKDSLQRLNKRKNNTKSQNTAGAGKAGGKKPANKGRRRHSVAGGKGAAVEEKTIDE